MHFGDLAVIIVNLKRKTIMEKKIAVITGGSRGIGAATAKLFAQNGYAVCINYKSNETAAFNTVKEITDAGGRCISIKADVSNEADVVRLFNTVDEKLGRLSV